MLTLVWIGSVALLMFVYFGLFVLTMRERRATQVVREVVKHSQNAPAKSERTPDAHVITNVRWMF